MIKFELMEACENCSSFEAKQLHMRTIVDGDEIKYCHYITCQHADKCAALLEYLKEEVKKDGR